MTTSSPLASRRPSTFTIHFPDGRFAPAIHVQKDDDPQQIIERFNLLVPCPALFISGGAGQMSQDDVVAAQEIIADGIAVFAEEHHLAVVDGGTDSGVMSMIGQVRRERRYKFPLIGVAPIGRVAFPGHDTIDSDAALHEGHSHFVLVEGNEWGDESSMMVNMVRRLAQDRPKMGILINGGMIAERDVYIATTQGDNSIPMVVLEGSGRKADEIATAMSTGETDSKIIKAIIKGGRITVASIKAGVEAMRLQLAAHFLMPDALDSGAARLSTGTRVEADSINPHTKDNNQQTRSQNE